MLPATRFYPLFSCDFKTGALDMLVPPIPHNEDARIAALHALNVLDSEPEERFDRLTRLAK